MPMRFLLAVCTGMVCIGSANALTQGAPPRAPTPAEPIAQILNSFRTHKIVTITDPHGNEQVQAFILALIRDQRFRDLVDDVVIETASSRYQDVIDRFVRGDDVPRPLIRKAWEDHTVANSLGRQAEELMLAVRAVNGSANGTRKLRVIAGDPPIDWENITSQEDQFRWVGLRDSYPADLVRIQSLERGRRALVVYGQGHLQRHQVASNYDMSSWQAQTVVSLIERDAAVQVFNIWTWVDRSVDLKEVASWPVPSLATLKGTTLGERDFGTYASGLIGGNRFAVQDGRLVPLSRDQWRLMPMEKQFDALLYLGLPTGMTFIGIAPDLCRDTEFVRERVRRLTLAAPPPELAGFKKACGL